MKNWAGNITYSSSGVLAPRTVDEAQERVAYAELLKPLGTRHSFSRIADTEGVQLSTQHLNRIVEIVDCAVTVEAGIRYGELGAKLAEHGLALPNYASLPHISVGGAIATSTHGSGARNQSLAATVTALDLVRGDGSLLHLDRTSPDFDGAVVALGSLGLVVRVTLT